MSYSEFITINKLCDTLENSMTLSKESDTLPEEELKAIQVYFDDFITDKFYKNKVNVQILFLSLVYKNGTQKIMTYKEFRDLFPGAIWLNIPKRSFSQQLLNVLTKRMMKVYIKADKVNYKTSYYQIYH